jgi:hypothetical protein
LKPWPVKLMMCCFFVRLQSAFGKARAKLFGLYWSSPLMTPQSRARFLDSRIGPAVPEKRSPALAKLPVLDASPWGRNAKTLGGE